MSKKTTSLQKAQTFTKKPIAAMAKHVVNNGFHIDTDGDLDIIEKDNNCWDDLNGLKEALGNALVEFVYQVQTMVHSPQITDNLGERRDEFDRLVGVFNKDIDTYASQIADLRIQHEHMSGSMTTLDEMNLFTNLSMRYQVIQVELQSLLAPTLANLTLLINEIVPMSVPVAVTAPTTNATALQQEGEYVH